MSIFSNHIIYQVCNGLWIRRIIVAQQHNIPITTHSPWLHPSRMLSVISTSHFAFCLVVATTPCKIVVVVSLHPNSLPHKWIFVPIPFVLLQMNNHKSSSPNVGSRPGKEIHRWDRSLTRESPCHGPTGHLSYERSGIICTI